MDAGGRATQEQLPRSGSFSGIINAVRRKRLSSLTLKPAYLCPVGIPAYICTTKNTDDTKNNNFVFFVVNQSIYIVDEN
jgi:hypothetical protein